MGVQYRCENEERRDALRTHATLTGIDYLEVSEDQRELHIYFVPGEFPGKEVIPEPESEEGPDNGQRLAPRNVAITGGTRIKTIRVSAVDYPEDRDDMIVVSVTDEESTDGVGDLSTYTLSLVKVKNLDPLLSRVSFSFKAGRPTEFDPGAEAIRPGAVWPAPQIDYLAKDYASFRQLMLDRLAVIMPSWRERNPADLGVVLVELLAYAADQLSYHQDAVATEAYLDTARKRVSVRRHARLLDYPMHDGSNARVWVTVRVRPGADGVTLPGPSKDLPGSMLLTQIDTPGAVVEPHSVPPAPNAGTEIFETLHGLRLREVHNEMRFYTWGDEHCCLPKGATRASLRQNYPDQSGKEALIDLNEGYVLIFEEVRGPQSGRSVDADPTHRHAVRLTKVTYTTDPLYNEEGDPDQEIPAQEMRVVDLEWAPEDALPFPLCLWEVDAEDEDLEGKHPVSVARGNVVLADHGRTIRAEPLGDIPERGRYHPKLRFGALTQQGHARDWLGRPLLDEENLPMRFDPGAPASAAMRWELRDVMPAIELRDDDQVPWYPQRDLLNSDRFAAEFVVETEDDGSAYLRFGDAVMGRPAVDRLKANYRIGNGRAGNVGAGAITHIVIDPELLADPEGAIEEVRNPLPARGGTDPESIEQVRLYAPHAFRTQERAVTEADYEAAAQRHPEVQRATATRRWSGSWYTWFVTVDRKGGRPVDAAFESEMREFLERFRLAGYDLEVDAPRFVPLDLAFTVQVASGYIRGNVKHALLETFGNVDLSEGRRGFFHPDNFTFGQTVYLSQMISVAMGVAGVAWIEPFRFQRWGEAAHYELEDGRITFDRLEIARLDNNPDVPDNGKLEFHMEGGL